MSKMSLQSTNGGITNESSLCAHRDFRFCSRRIGNVGVQFTGIPEPAAGILLRQSNLSAWPALSSYAEVVLGLGLPLAEGAAL